MAFSKWVFITVAAVSAATVTYGYAPAAHAETQQPSKAAQLAAALVAATKAAIASSTDLTRQGAVETALQNALEANNASAADANSALNIAEAELKKQNLWTPPVEKAFATARKAVAALIKPAAGPTEGGVDLGAPPETPGGGGSQTGTYGTP